MRRGSLTLVAAVLVTAVSPVWAGTVSAAEPDTSAYVPVGPVRLADTRRATCGCQRVDADTVRVAVTAHTEVPDNAVAAAVTITALPTAAPAFVSAYPGGTARPHTSTVNTVPGRVVANSAIVPLGDDGTLDVFSKLPGDVIVDVTGVFVPAAAARAGRFMPVNPQRLIDTRTGGGPLAPGGELTVALPAGVAADATALAVNVTSVDDTLPGHLSARPAGTPAGRPTSFVNLDGSGRATAAAVILPAAPGGVTIASHGGGHLVVDLVGWFTGASAREATDGLFVPSTPRRLIDTRVNGPRLRTWGTREVAGVAGASALVTNVTAVDADWRGYVSAYPAGTERPGTSTVNPGYHNHTVANLAITRLSSRGVAYFALGGTDLVVDVTGHFTGAPVNAPHPPAPNPDVAPRVLIVGDSAMAALGVFTDARRALAGADFYVDAANCRRLVHPSCRSDVTGLIPNTALDAIRAAPGWFDIVYMDVGHNDWNDPDFAWQVDTIIQAARAKGAKIILWATYTEHVRIQGGAAAAYAWNNAMLRSLNPLYPDMVIADWSTYSSTRPQWFWDGTHMYRSGAWGVADYIARWTAAITHRACPAPWVRDGAVANPCPHPDAIGAPPDVMSIYS
ncbi:MAG TPA: hypothetical protein VNQ73_13450 [Ilumatobacter sp.]|nr:hypothetical protein [Ilumatobacter sp.]